MIYKVRRNQKEVGVPTLLKKAKHGHKKRALGGDDNPCLSLQLRGWLAIKIALQNFLSVSLSSYRLGIRQKRGNFFIQEYQKGESSLSESHPDFFALSKADSSLWIA